MGRIFFTPEVKEYIAANAAGINYKEMVDKLRNELGFVITLNQLRTYYHHNRIHAGRCNSRLYTREVKEYILEIYRNRHVEDLVVMVNEKFDTDFTRQQIKTYLNTNGLVCDVPKGLRKGTLLSYTDEEKQFIIENQYGISRKELTERFNKAFPDHQISVDKMRCFCLRNGLLNGLDGRYKKGNVSPNKGKKGLKIPGAEKGWFKKGNVPSCYLPVGTEKYDRRGGWKVKVGDPKKWRQKSWILWEQANGPIPEGFIVTYKDNDNHNCVLENLVLVTRQECAYRSFKDLFSSDPELNMLGIEMARMHTAVMKVRRKMDGHSGKDRTSGDS